MITDIAYVLGRLAVGAVIGAALGAGFFGAVTAARPPVVNDCHRQVIQVVEATPAVQTTDTINIRSACR